MRKKRKSVRARTKRKPELDNFYNELQKELIVKRNALGFLISQQKILGDYTEKIIMDFLKSKIRKFHVSRGLIVGDGGENSPECDILIYNDLFQPLFNVSDVAIVKNVCVRVVIEVKSILSGLSGLKKIKEHINKVGKIAPSVYRYFLIIFTSKIPKDKIQNEFSVYGNWVKVFVLTYIKEKPIRYDVGNINKGELKSFLKELEHI